MNDKPRRQLECEHVAGCSGTKRFCFVVNLFTDDSIALCEGCYDRLKGAILEDVISTPIERIAKRYFIMGRLNRER